MGMLVGGWLTGWLVGWLVGWLNVGWLADSVSWFGR